MLISTIAQSQRPSCREYYLLASYSPPFVCQVKGSKMHTCARVSNDLEAKVYILVCTPVRDMQLQQSKQVLSHILV